MDRSDPRSPRESHRIDRYEVLEELARGASGAVYRARDVQLGREVAIKVLLGTHDDNARQRERFRREGESLAKVRHPHVVAVHAVGETGGRPYLVLDLVDGRSLQDRIDQDGPLPPREATALIATLARALEHLHAQGLLHRDLKPDNVLLRAEDGAPLLTDFGLVRDEASDRSRLSRTGQMLGTPGFWAPEQARGDVNLVGPTTDVYGLGAVYFACLTGEPPIDGASLIQILAATQQAEIPAPSTLCAAVEPAIDRVCLHALNRQAEDRYPTAAAFAEDLERILEGGRVRARRRARVWSVGGGVAVVLGLSLVVGLGVWRAWIVPTRVADRVEKAQALVERARLTEAEPLLLEALELDPDNVVAWTLKAQCERSHGKVEAAKASVARALALDPTHAPALIERAQMAIRERDLPGALRDYDAVLVHEPEHLGALYGRAHLRRGAKDLAGSTADLARALALDPDRPAGRLSTYAAQLLELGRESEALAAITQAVEGFGPDPVDGERQLAKQAYVGSSEFPSAVRDLDRAIGLLPAAHPDRITLQRRRHAVNEMIRKNSLSR